MHITSGPSIPIRLSDSKQSGYGKLKYLGYKERFLQSAIQLNLKTFTSDLLINYKTTASVTTQDALSVWGLWLNSAFYYMNLIKKMCHYQDVEKTNHVSSTKTRERSLLIW